MALKQISIEREYEKHPEIKPGDIKNLREWLRTQPHLPGDLLSDVDLLVVYHCCDNSTELTKQLIDHHFTLRTLFEQFFHNRKVDRNTEIAINKVFCFPMPTPTVDGCLSFYVRLLDIDPKNFHFVEYVKTFMLIFDLWQYENGTCAGGVMIIDMEGVSVSHLAKIDIMVLKKVLYFVQEAMLIQIKEINFINAPAFIDKLMMMMRPFLNKSLLDIIKIHTVGSDSIYQRVQKKALPKEYGGEYKDVPTIKSELWQRLKANKDFFEMENKRRVNEKLRPGKPTTIEQLFGIQGSFKKLDID